MTPLLNQTTSLGACGITPADARISGAMHPAAPSMAHLQCLHPDCCIGYSQAVIDVMLTACMRLAGHTQSCNSQLGELVRHC